MFSGVKLSVIEEFGKSISVLTELTKIDFEFKLFYNFNLLVIII